MTITSFFSTLATRLGAWRLRRRRKALMRPALGYREMLDLGVYRGHVDRVASAMNEAV